MSDRSFIDGYSHVAIVVDDLDHARPFYCDVLGFDELPRPDLGLPGMWLKVGSLQLHFIENETMPIPGPGFPHLALHVPSDDWEQEIQRLRGHGVEFLMGPSERVDFGRTVRAAFLTDPSGNVIEITDVGPITQG